MKQLWDWLKANWKAVASVVGSIGGYILFKQHFQKDLKAQLKNVDAKVQDSVLEERRSNIEQARAAEEAKSQKLRNQLNKDSNTSNDEDVISFYKKK